MSNTWERAAAHAARHHGVLSTRSAAGLGIAPATLHGWVRSGRLHHPVPRTFVVVGAPQTWHQKATIATASSDAWASHATATALWDLDGSRRGRIEVLTLHGRRRDRARWTVHETRRLRAVDLDEVDGVPCTSVARTILDLPAVAPPYLVGKALDHACRRWPGMLDVIVQRFLELGGRGRRGTRLLREMLAERLGLDRFTQSDFESNALDLVRSIGLPEPVLQHEVRDDDFAAFLDMAWPPIMLGLECDSLAHHFGKADHEWEHRRRRRLQRLGWAIIEVTYDDVAYRAQQTGRELLELYRERERAITLVSAALRDG